MKLAANATQKQLAKLFSNNNMINSEWLTIDQWRMEKGKPMIQKEGKTWYWCPKYVSPGKYKGLHVTHKPEDHK